MDIRWQAGTDPDDDAAVTRPLQQSAAYAAALALLGAETARCTIHRDGQPLGAARLVARRFGPVRMSLMSRGPVWFDAAPDLGLAPLLRAMAPGRGAFIVTPGRMARGGGLVPLARSRDRALLDLRPDAAALRRGLARTWRYRLVRAEAGGLATTLGPATPAGVAALLAADQAQQRDKGYRGIPPNFTHAWLAAAPAAALLAEAWVGRERVAAMLFLRHAPWATYHVAWTSAEGRRRDAHRVLLWQAMLFLRDAGITCLDLGDVDFVRAPGLAQFKAGTGAALAPTGATCLVLPRPILRRS